MIPRLSMVMKEGVTSPGEGSTNAGEGGTSESKVVNGGDEGANGMRHRIKLNLRTGARGLEYPEGLEYPGLRKLADQDSLSRHGSP